MPIREMELVATAPLPDLDAFLPRWLRYLERSAPPKDKWDYAGDARAPGLGWSDEEHPGHLLFPAFAAMLTEGSGTELDPALWESLRERSWTAIHGDVDRGDPGEDDGTGRPGGAASRKLDTPSAPDLLALARPGIGLDSRDRAAVLRAMRAAATKRTQEVLANKRRRHYGHAAALVACCLQVFSGIGEQDSALAWMEGLRKEYSRFPAFRGELKTALGWASLR